MTAIRSGHWFRRSLRSLLRLLLILFMGICLGLLLLMASFLLPIDPMEQNLLLSIPALDGTWGTGEEAYEQMLKGYETTQLDNTTDAFMLLCAIHRSDNSLLDRAVNVYTYHHEINYKLYATLQQYGQTGLEDMRDTVTARYWMGYLIFLKPLLLFFTYMDIRMLNILLQGFLLLAIFLLLQRRGLGRYAFALALSLVCVTPAVTGFSLQFSTSFLVMGLGMLLLLWKPRWVETRLHDGAFFLLLGMATSYFDFLTYPLITFGMPFVLWLLIHREEAGRQRFLRLLRCAAAWGLGYLGMWGGKWMIAALYGSEDFLSTLIGSLETRTSGEAAGGVAITRLDALVKNFSVFFKKPYLLLAIVVSLFYGVQLWRTRTLCPEGTPSFYAVLLLLALLPILWLLLTANHAYIHAFYTSRILAVTAFSVLCALSALTAPKERNLST